MATSLITITNISNQAVPILINNILLEKSNSNSDFGYSKANQTVMAPGTQMTIEKQRIDIGQIDRLRGLGLLTY